eukprot:scaffold6678_cov336-Prasinococcus_capsulatus_cf.AAC.9
MRLHLVSGVRQQGHHHEASHVHCPCCEGARHGNPRIPHGCEAGGRAVRSFELTAPRAGKERYIMAPRRCAKCGYAYQMQSAQPRADNSDPRQAVPIELIEMQISFDRTEAWDAFAEQYTSKGRGAERATPRLLPRASTQHCPRCAGEYLTRELGCIEAAYRKQLAAYAAQQRSPFRVRCPLPEPPRWKAIIFSSLSVHVNFVNTLLQRTAYEYRTTYQLGQRRVDMEAALESFRTDDRVNVLLLDRRNAEGLDLSFVTHIFIMEPLSDLSLEEQVISRAYRMGQQHKVTIYVLAMRNTIEQQLMELQREDKVLSASAAKEATAQKSVLTHLRLVAVPPSADEAVSSCETLSNATPRTETSSSELATMATPSSGGGGGGGGGSGGSSIDTGNSDTSAAPPPAEAAPPPLERPAAPAGAASAASRASALMTDYIASLQYHQDLEQRRVEGDAGGSSTAAIAPPPAPKPKKRVRFADMPEQHAGPSRSESQKPAAVESSRSVRFAEVDVGARIERHAFAQQASHFLEWLRGRAVAAAATGDAEGRASQPAWEQERRFGLAARRALFAAPSLSAEAHEGADTATVTGGEAGARTCQVLARVSVARGAQQATLQLTLANGLRTTVAQLAAQVCAHVGAVPAQLTRLVCLHPPRSLLAYGSSPLVDLGVADR